eukprot:CAMPEP_0177662948 /NCGR_PEP_ID=MMETSP0447-20121125/19636_1 /TAXON_ID=0 /ORGANISM="Stygamoeba regulata, Strain BSH-02190019" /LENGTH=66 /DNA_ID=CAMNT_0019168695 /DNA_START=666 /DNA_END=862 /DNA_ORIENTATION=-
MATSSGPKDFQRPGCRPEHVTASTGAVGVCRTHAAFPPTLPSGKTGAQPASSTNPLASRSSGATLS